MHRKAKGRKSRLLIYSLSFLAILQALDACSISEEVKRIEASKQYEERQEASRSTDLTGDQIFIRSCNTCHPGGKQGVGPSLMDISSKWPDDNALKAFIRKGKGVMPEQPASVINNAELDRLIAYLRTLKKE